MEDALTEKLDELGLSDFRPRLLAMGVQSRTDITFLRDADLKEAGFNLVQIRKLQHISADGQGKLPKDRIPWKEAKSASMASIHEDEDDKDGDEEEEEEEQGSISRSMSNSTANWARVSEDGKYIEVAPMDRVSTATRRRTSTFWSSQLMGRPMRLIFVRHGESEANVDRTITSRVPDHLLHLTENGRKQALEAGQRLRSLIGTESVKFIVSPYVRTRETLNGILRAWDDVSSIPVREEVRIREQEYGNFDDPDIGTLHKEKRKFGAFYYRFPAGESAADCYDRASLFLESMYRSWIDNSSQNQVVVCHGMMILVTLMRLLRLPIEEFDRLDSLKNCEFVVLERTQEDAKYSIAFTWSPGSPQDERGLRRKEKPDRPPLEIWDGNPDVPLLSHTSTQSD